MLKKHQILLAPDVAEAPVGGNPKTELKQEFQAPRPTGWMKKIGSLNRETQDEPVAEPIKEEEKPNGEKSAGGGSDKNGSGKKPGVEDGADAGKPKVAGNADKKPVAKAKDAKEAKGEVVLPPTEDETESETAAGETAKGKETESGEEAEDTVAPKSNKDWEKWKAKRAERETELRTQAKAASDRAEALAAKVAEFEKGAGVVDPEIKSRLERSEATVKELSDRLEQVDVERHPHFQKFYGEQTDGVHQDIKTILGDDTGKSFIDLLALPDSDFKKSQMAEFYASMDDIQKSQIGGAIGELRRIDKERKKDIQDAKTKTEQLKEQRKGKAAALEQQWVTEVGSQLTALRDPANGFSAFQKRAGDDEGTKRWNASVDAREEQVKEFLTGKDVSPKAVVKAAIDAASLPIYKALYNRDSAAWKAEKAKLEETIKTLTAAQPGGGRGEGGEKERKVNPVLEKGLSPTQRSKNWAKMIASDMNGGGQ